MVSMSLYLNKLGVTYLFKKLSLVTSVWVTNRRRFGSIKTQKEIFYCVSLKSCSFSFRDKLHKHGQDNLTYSRFYIRKANCYFNMLWRGVSWSSKFDEYVLICPNPGFWLVTSDASSKTKKFATFFGPNVPSISCIILYYTSKYP